MQSAIHFKVRKVILITFIYPLKKICQDTACDKMQQDITHHRSEYRQVYAPTDNQDNDLNKNNLKIHRFITESLSLSIKIAAETKDSTHLLFLCTIWPYYVVMCLTVLRKKKRVKCMQGRMHGRHFDCRSAVRFRGLKTQQGINNHWCRHFDC